MSALIHRLLLGAALALSPLALAAGPAATEPAAVKTAPAGTAAKAAARQAPAKKAVAKTPATKKPAAKATTATKKKTAAAHKPAAKKTVAAKSKPRAGARNGKSRKATAAAVATAATAAAVNFDELDAYRNVARAYLVKIGDDVIWEGAADQRLPPASLTKMMTALLVLESYRPDDVVEVSPAAAAEGGSRLGLRAGDRVLRSDLLAATLIRSANDACHALADWHSGSEAVFVARMNQRAEQLGLRDTHFMNACGFDNPEHYSSARDLAAIAETAMQNPTFARIVTKERLAFRSVDGRRTFRIKTTNHLLGALDGAQGVKTGFTNGAGPCLVAMAERDGERVLLVLLNARNRWWNATAMIDSAFVQGPRIAAKKRLEEQQAASAAQARPAARPAAEATLARGV